MNWFYAALLAPLLFAIANYIDKYLLSKYIRGGGIGSLIIFSCLFSVFVIPIILLLYPTVLSVGIIDIILLVFVGILNTLGVLLYLYALNRDEASIVVPLMQITPVFGLLFSFILFRETINGGQALSAILIIFGAILLSLDFTRKKIEFKYITILYMSFSTMSFGLHGSIFKLVAVKENFILSFFWEYVGLLIVGIFFLFFVEKYRNEFFELLRNNPRQIFFLNITNESIVFIGNAITAYSFTVAPVSLVLAVSGYQPLFILIIGVTLTLFFPNIVKEDIKIHHLSYKFVAILLIISGGYLLNIF